MGFAEWAAVGEILASLGVVVTLLLLWQQLRLNNTLVRRQMRVDQQSLIYTPMLTSPAVLGVAAKIRRKSQRAGMSETLRTEFDLTEEEAVLWWIYRVSQIARHAADFRYFGPSDEIEIVLRPMLQARDVQLVWEASRGIFPADFQEYVESLRIVRPDSGT